MHVLYPPSSRLIPLLSFLSSLFSSTFLSSRGVPSPTPVPQHCSTSILIQPSLTIRTALVSSFLIFPHALGCYQAGCSNGPRSRDTVCGFCTPCRWTRDAADLDLFPEPGYRGKQKLTVLGPGRATITTPPSLQGKHHGQGNTAARASSAIGQQALPKSRGHGNETEVTQTPETTYTVQMRPWVDLSLSLRQRRRRQRQPLCAAATYVWRAGPIISSYSAFLDIISQYEH